MSKQVEQEIKRDTETPVTKTEYPGWPFPTSNVKTPDSPPDGSGTNWDCIR